MVSRVSPSIPASGIVTCILTGKADPGDQLYFHWCDGRGGRSSSCHEVAPGQTNEEIVQSMVGLSPFPSWFALAAKGNKIVCIVNPACPYGTLCTEVIGTGTAELTLE